MSAEQPGWVLLGAQPNDKKLQNAALTNAHLSDRKLSFVAQQRLLYNQPHVWRKTWILGSADSPVDLWLFRVSDLPAYLGCHKKAGEIGRREQLFASRFGHA